MRGYVLLFVLCCLCGFSSCSTVRIRAREQYVQQGVNLPGVGWVSFVKGAAHTKVELPDAAPWQLFPPVYKEALFCKLSQLPMNEIQIHNVRILRRDISSPLLELDDKAGLTYQVVWSRMICDWVILDIRR